MYDFEQLARSVITGNSEAVISNTKQCLVANAKPLDIINKGFINGMSVVGQRFKSGDMYVPEVLMAARAMHQGMDLVKPLLLEGEMPSFGKVVLGTVEGDLHDIGKNLVAMMMESAGLEVIDLGTDVKAESFAQAVKEHHPEILGMSALLTTTMLAIKDTIDVLEEHNLKDSVKIIIGGAPVTLDFANEVGADGWAPDAAAAKDLALDLIEKAKKEQMS